MNNYTFGLYEVLEIPSDATLEQVKKAYKRLALQYHPDRSTGNKEKFQQIAMAYEVLSDKSKRQEYDLLDRMSKSRSTKANQGPDPVFYDMKSFYERHNSLLNPFKIFTEIFGEFCDIVNLMDSINQNNGNSPLSSGLMFHIAPILANSMGVDGVKVQKTMSFISSLDPNQMQQNYMQPKPPIKTKPIKSEGQIHYVKPIDIVQSIQVPLLDIYQNKIKKFNLARIRNNKEEKTLIEIPLMHRQVTIPEAGDWLQGWEKPGNVVINISCKVGSEKDKGYFRINDFDIMGYHHIGIVEWYSKVTTITLIDGSQIKVPLQPSTPHPMNAQGPGTLVESNLILKIPGLGLPLGKGDEVHKNRGSLYIQLVILPPDPADIDVDDLPQFIKILGSVPNLDKQTSDKIRELTDTEILISPNNKFELANYDETLDS